jgi:hypothetical protein
MSDTPYQQPTQAAGVTDVVTQLQNIVRQLTALVAAIKGRVTFGTFTLGAAVTTTVPQAAVQANSEISLSPTNASAATLMGSAKSLYISAIVPATSFTVATANTTNAAGTETFSYTVRTPT